MSDWEVIDHQEIPGDDGTIYLLRDGVEFSIDVNGNELMSDTDHGSEDALAELAIAALPNGGSARVLVGGLGMGFTLAAALSCVGEEGVVTVAELMSKVVEWNRKFVGGPSGHPLRDPRSRVYEGDVADLVMEPPHPWDAILLDVDNGPKALTTPRNGWLYTRQGLRAAKQALSPTGVLAVWSAARDRAFTSRLRKNGFDVTVVHCPQWDEPGEADTDIHVLWLARPRPSSATGKGALTQAEHHQGRMRKASSPKG